MTSAMGRFLRGVHAPVAEEVTASDLEVRGALPAFLDGRYLRNGPNPHGPVDLASYHWFTGTGMVHGLRIAEGAARWYRNRWVRSAEVAAALGEPRRPGEVHGGMDFAPNTNVIAHAGRTLAIVEAGARPYALTEELDSIGPCDFDGTLADGYTAHPKVDPTDGSLHGLSYWWGHGDRLTYTATGADGTVRAVAHLHVGGAIMQHDVALTQHHLVVLDLPVTFDLDAAATGASFPYRWQPDRPARVGLVARQLLDPTPHRPGTAGVAPAPTVVDEAQIRWFDVEPCYVFHTLGAYEEGEDVVLDVVRHPRMFATSLDGPDEGTPTLQRWRLTPGRGDVATATIDDRGHEFPRIDDALLGRPYRYGYTVGMAPGSRDLVAASIHRFDLHADTSTVHQLGPGRTGGEFTFVARPDATAEGDGVLMGFVHDAATDRSELLVLDAPTMEAVASVQLPVRVPSGFHGNWCPTPA